MGVIGLVNRSAVGRKSKTFGERVFELVGTEYTFLDEYVNQKETPKLVCRHNTCGHIWEVSVKHFLWSGTRCPMCTKEETRRRRLKSNDAFVKEVYSEVGDEYLFTEDYKGTDTKIGCVHNTCGTEYEVTPYKFLSGRRCPACAVRARGLRSRTTSESFRRYFDETFTEYTLLDDYTTQNTAVRIKHNPCGTIFERLPKATIRNGTVCCDYCNIRSFGARVVQNELDSLGVDYILEYRFDDCRSSYPLPFDFAILTHKKVVGLIEYDGRQHTEVSGGFFGGEDELLERIARDKIKTEYCANNTIPLLRLPWTLTEEEIKNNTNVFINNIMEAW